MKRPSNRELERAWHGLVAMVMDTRDEWRRKVTEATGLPFTRVRALRRLSGGPLTLGELADALSSDAPAATVAVNALERRGLVVRREHPSDRRAKLVSLTPEGRAMVRLAKNVHDAPPEAFAALTDEDVAGLLRVLDRVGLRVERRAKSAP